MCGSSVAYCVMSTLVRLPQNMNPYVTVFFRFAIGLGLLGILAMSGKIKLTFVHTPFLVLRGLAGAIAVFIWFLSISALGLGKGTVIFYSYPVFASVFSVIFLKEKVSFLKWIAAAFAFSGVVLLVMGKDITSLSIYSVGIYEMIAVFGAVLGGSAVVLVKKLVETDSSWSIYFAQCLAGFWLFIGPANLSGGSLEYSGFFLLICVGVTATIGQLLMTEGYRRIPVTTGATLIMLVPVLNMLTGILIFKEPVSAIEISGAAMVVVSSAFLAIYDAVSKPLS